MKLYKISLALLMGLSTLASCEDKLEITNPNQQTTSTYGNNAAELEECVIAAYNHIRMEGSYGRVGYNIDVCRGDEAWNSSQVWYLPFDDLNVSALDEICMWSWREWFYTINVCNFVTNRCDGKLGLPEDMNRAYGQALFLRALAYYNLVGYYQNPALITDYSKYSSLDGLYSPNYVGEDKDPNTQFDRVLDQVEQDLIKAKSLLPSRDTGGEWAKGRATCGAAAGYLARVYMQRHKYAEALQILEEIMNKEDGGKQLYGTYKLMPNFGDNFREGPAYENNQESLFEVQFLDKDQQGTDDEWTPVNTSPNATQGSAIESNFAPGDVGGWADISASPWLYHLFKQEKTKGGKLDPRLYWTIGTYEDDWNGFEFGNVCYTKPMTDQDTIVTNNTNGGLPIAKWTHFRTGEYPNVVVGLRDGINLRLMRYSDVLLRAAECINEIEGVTPRAIELINKVRERANLNKLDINDFHNSADELFEQIANVERPKEFGCEYGRGLDLLRWGWFYDENRLTQLKEHGTFRRTADKSRAKEPVDYQQVGIDPELKSSFDNYLPGHEFLPIYQSTLNDNANLIGNSANASTSNASYYQAKQWRIHPVVKR